MQVNLLLIVFLLLIYFICSSVVFVITSQGWNILVQTSFSIILFFLTILILIVGRFFRADTYIPMELFWTYLKLIVITQIVTILFNPGDSGSGSSSYYFYQTIWGKISGDYSGTAPNNDIPFITRLAYHGVLIAFAIYIAFIAKRS
ncbi:MAG: hypothetical protein EBE86_007670 [Hormoscilla sp. GUM202]|nr:hypothetical protein [Hormoscilla sp. GUM202]